MASKKLFRVKREHIRVIPKISNYYCEKAFAEGWVFIQEEGHSDIHMLHSRANKQGLEVNWIEKIEIVERPDFMEGNDG